MISMNEYKKIHTSKILKILNLTPMCAKEVDRGECAGLESAGRATGFKLMAPEDDEFDGCGGSLTCCELSGFLFETSVGLGGGGS